MANDYYLPHSDNERRPWLSNFALKLPNYASKYGISSADVDNTKDGALYFGYWLDYKDTFKTYTQALTSWKNTLMNGIMGTPPVMPTLPVAPAKVVAPGIFPRVQSIVARIKANTAYSPDDGNDMGIEGAEIFLEPESMKPVLELRLIGGGFAEVVWKKQGMHALEIWRMEEGGEWHFLAVDTIPNYTDKTPMPAGTSKIVRYKAIYKFHDENVGAWSEEYQITVTG